MFSQCSAPPSLLPILTTKHTHRMRKPERNSCTASNVGTTALAMSRVEQSDEKA